MAEERSNLGIGVRLETLSRLSEAVKTIRKLSPNTESVYTFREGIANMGPKALAAFTKAIDDASLLVNELDRQIVFVRGS